MDLLRAAVAMHRRSAAILFLTLLPAVAAQSAESPVAQATLLGELFQDHAVLQRDRPIAIWGRADSGKTVSVTLGSATVHASADAEGIWSAQLPSMAAGGPYELTVQTSSGARQVVRDVLLGEVFLCSGQSNMEMQVRYAGDAFTEVRNSSHDTIRLLNVAHASTPSPLRQFSNPVTWQTAGPDTVADWSAVCYFFARELQKSIQVPIGLLHSSWGGSNIRPWLSSQALRASGGYTGALELLDLYARDEHAAQIRFAAEWQQWWRAKSGAPPGSEPWNPRAGKQALKLRRAAVPAAPEWRKAPDGLGDWRKWDVPELRDFTGALWYRTTFKLTAAQARASASLSLGTINQVDQTWINGQPVGNTFGYDMERTYALSPGMLHAGMNTLVINVMSTWGSGGLLAGPTQRALHLSAGESIPLQGEWQYSIMPSTLGYPPRTPWDPVGGVASLYNAMIAPLGSYGLRGMLWYQGESNTGEAQSYQRLLGALMADRRRQFGDSLPVLVVQLPNFGPPVVAPTESDWSSLREAQRLAVANDAKAGLAVTIDIGEPRNLHPTDKQDVAIRLARVARKVIYGEAISAAGPVPRRVIRAPAGVSPQATATGSGQIEVEFTDVDGALVAYSHDSPIGFELCGDSPRTCQFAQARIEGTKVLLSIPPGPPPTRVRYCWGDSPVCTLFDLAGLPAGPFELRLGESAAATTFIPAGNAAPELAH